MKVEDTNGWPNRLLLATMLPSSWLLLLALRLGLCLVLFRREATRAAALVMSSGWHAWLSFLTHSYYQCLVGDFFFLSSTFRLPILLDGPDRFIYSGT